MSHSLEKLKTLLAELFQMDRAELDFGIYRIMNAKRDEINRFLDQDLLPQVRKAFQAYETENRTAVEEELAQAIQKGKELGVDPETTQKVKELRARLTEAADVTALENEVYSHLYSFFRRYYHEGDFISLRRYKEGVYAIPYEGEEVKLYWANHDQYYIKTSEHLRDYRFRLLSGALVHFMLVEADTEKDSNRAANGNERRFILSEEQPLVEENGELVIRFDYRPHPDKARQADLNAAALDRILNQTPGFDAWRRELAAPRPTEKNPNRTLLEKHLTDYTARNTFDYFIHKDLGGFLKRELDFYIKNEVMYLDDIESETVPRVEQYLSKIKAIRRIAHKLIDFLAQIENFQKNLWLKKKFVVETQYCITLDRIFSIENRENLDWLIDQIIKNDAQREEWVTLCAIDEIKSDLATPGYSKPLKPEFLEAHPTLLVDTRHFNEGFKLRLLAAIPDLDGITDGLLIHSENFQALGCLEARYSGSVDVLYADPPYNTDASPILYKNDYKSSSWLSLVENRMSRASRLLKKAGVACFAIDDEEVAGARVILGRILPKEIGIAAVRANPQSRKAKGRFSPVHEYALFFGRSGAAGPGTLEITEARQKRYQLRDDRGSYAWMNMIRTGSGDKREDRPKLYYPILVDDHNQIRIADMTWDDEKGEYVLNEAPRENETLVFPVAERNGQTIEKRWHRGPDTVASDLSEYRVRRDESGAISIDFKTRMDELAPPTTWWNQKEYASANYGAAELKALFGDNPFDYPKAVRLVEDCLRASNVGEESDILDPFAGSGTTGHAVINLNRADGGERMSILVEMGDYFNTVLVPRIKKVTYTPEWKDGKPKRRPTGEEIERSPRIVKILRLESYEDTLSNLEPKRTGPQHTLLEQQPGFREDYVLRYMLDIETRESPSLLNIDRFEDPFNYKLNIATGTAGETQPTVVDLVETFNYLIGLRVKTIDDVRGVRVVTGTNPQGERVLILWRKNKELDNDALDAWFRKQGYNTKDQEYDVIYVNGDNNLENLRKPDQTWKVRLTEEEFRRLMFDVQEAEA